MGATEPQIVSTVCDHDEWFRISLAIQLFAGFVCGTELGAQQLHGALELPRWQAIPLGVLLGLPGLSPTATAAISVRARDPKMAFRSIKRMKLLELAVETLPQCAFQTFVALAQRKVRPALLLSILIGVLSAGGSDIQRRN